MPETNRSAAIVLIPTTDDWCKQDFAHTTLIYLGDDVVSKSSLFNELLKVTYQLAMLTSPFWLKVSGVEVFGKEEKVDVLRLSSTPELLSLRGFFEEWDDGSFPKFEPHATIGPEGSVTNWNSQSTPMPIALLFDRICIWWGDKKTIFWLKK